MSSSHFIRCALLLLIAALATPAALFGTTDPVIVIALEHYWTCEVAGVHFGLVQFGAADTTIFVGRWHWNVPLPAPFVSAPLFAAPALLVAGLLLCVQRRWRRTMV